MPYTLNQTKTLQAICETFHNDAMAAVRRFNLEPLPNLRLEEPKLPSGDVAALERLKECARQCDPMPPPVWHRTLHEALLHPRVSHMYFNIRSSLWSWPEFLPLNPKARLILEIVIELAREEAFPWYLKVQARHIMRLARTNHATFAQSMRAIQHLAITRSARRMALVNHDTDSMLNRCMQARRWPCATNNWCVNESQPVENIAQWVVRYRHGSPFNANRAAWWLNYDFALSNRAPDAMF